MLSSLLSICLLIVAVSCKRQRFGRVTFVDQPTDAAEYSSFLEAQYGGGGGGSFNDGYTAGTISSVTLCTNTGNTYLGSVQVSAAGVQYPLHGGGYTPCYTLTLGGGEYISSVSGRSGSYVDQVTLTTNTGRSITGGTSQGGSPFSVSGAAGTGITVISGRSGSWIDDLEFTTGVFNPCLNNNGGCLASATCTQSGASAVCTCPAGYTGNGISSCTDINECATSNGACDPTTTCTNTAGSRTCGVCLPGWAGTGAAGCVAPAYSISCLSPKVAAYSAKDRITGNQAWTGPLGLDFNVASAIEVSAVGAFDSAADGLSTLKHVSIYKLSTPPTLILSAIVPAGSTLPYGGGFRWLPLDSSVIISPGSYTIVAEGFGADQNGNSGVSAYSSLTSTYTNLITFVGAGRYSATAGAFPTTIDGGPANRYLAGSFIYERASTF